MKTEIYFLILIILFSLYSVSVYAEEKKLNVNVNVVAGNESNSQNPDNYLNLDNFGSSSGTASVNQEIEIKDSSSTERGVNPQYLQGEGGLASFRASNPWIFPIILIIFAIILIVIYFLRKKWKWKRKIIIKRK